MSIAKIERVSLRDVWKHEAHDFTKWLEENIDVLSDAISRDIENAERERKTESTFSVDLVAEGSDGSPIIIENQLEKSNHDHLGKLITYLTAMQAKVAIWIVADPRPEHVAAMTWLNESSSADFYLVKIEAIRIDSSLPAPLLTVIVGPSEEGKAIGRSKQEMSERHHTRYKWWSQLVQHPDATHHRHISPRHYSWMGLGSGVRGASFNYVVWQNEAAAELYVDQGKNKDHMNLHIFSQLCARKEEIEGAFGGPLRWEELEGKRACRLRVTVQGGYSDPEQSWKKTHDLMTDSMNRLINALEPHLQTLSLKDAIAPEGK